MHIRLVPADAVAPVGPREYREPFHSTAHSPLAISTAHSPLSNVPSTPLVLAGEENRHSKIPVKEAPTVALHVLFISPGPWHPKGAESNVLMCWGKTSRIEGDFRRFTATEEMLLQ